MLHSHMLHLGYLALFVRHPQLLAELLLLVMNQQESCHAQSTPACIRRDRSSPQWDTFALWDNLWDKEENEKDGAVHQRSKKKPEFGTHGLKTSDR
ncbi:hypothetical protein N7490_003896 [Penicillium lividum]|nr:hypothetical protein N7490_003896 [Penicillium lividum]